ncbi:uncharacterized protein TNCV_1784041 [Trichonephila clavipes]|nr:uncharacterized protein TNCV_1784041 [Trichonephila clavipes]
MRRTDVKLTRLRIGHTRFTHRHLLFGERALNVLHAMCSVLSVTLFIIHMSNILHQLPPSGRGMLYVDDLQVSCQGSDIKRNLHPDPSIHIGHIQIPVVSAVRFLGVIFDCKLTFLPHVLYLRKRCERSLNILKVLSNTLWGTDRVSLLRVYQALILSRLDYGCVVYGSARASVLKRLDTVYHSALRICSGAFKTSPVTSLYVGIGGEPKSVKRLRSGDLLIETTSALQTKSFLLAKSFLNSPVTVFPHKSLNSCRGVISEPDLLGTSDSEILEGFSGQGVTQCQRFGHSQTACRGQLTCSRCASVGHASSDCTLEQKCVNCSQPHSADSKLCPKWKIEKEIQTIKTNRNISYIEARKFITPQPSQTYAQVAKSITVNNSSQTDETITKIVCPPLKLLQPLITISKPIMSPSIPEVIKSSTSTQAELVPSTSSVTVASPSQSPPPNSVIDTTPHHF